jgi:hypothetical protein
MATTPARKNQPVSFDLDDFEREDDPGPFVVQLGGCAYEMVDAKQLDYRELIDLLVAAGNGDIVKTLGGMLDPKDREPFWKNKIPAFKLNALINGYMDHYGLDLGEADASSASSEGMARLLKLISPSED